MSKPTTPSPTPRQDPAVPRIAIIGWGLISPLGDGAWPTFRSLLAGRRLADRAGELPPDTAPLDLAKALGSVSSAQHGREDPSIELAERAAREAATMAGLPCQGLPVWLGTSKGAVARASQRLSSGHPIDEDTAQCLALGPHAYLCDRLCRRLKTVARGHHVAACSSGLVALDHARRALLNNPHPDQASALVIASEAAITPAFVASYQRLGVLGEMTAEHYNQRPLDERREGFMLSEMGVAVLLKRIEPGMPWPEDAAELVGTAIACEPHDMIRPAPKMTSLARLWQGLTADHTIDVIHPHAPGTREHDPAELDALLLTSSPAGSPMPDLYAVKGAIGHGLGASGLASLVVAALCLRTGQRPPMPWLTQPIGLPGKNPLPIEPGARPCDRSGVHAVLAAGFGGHLAGALLQGWPRQTTTQM